MRRFTAYRVCSATLLGQTGVKPVKSLISKQSLSHWPVDLTGLRVKTVVRSPVL